MKEAYLDLEHSSPPFHSLLEIEQDKISENPHDCPGILRDYKCPFRQRKKKPRGQRDPQRAPDCDPKQALIPLWKMSV